MIPYIEGNRIILLRSGTEYFPALEHAIEQARGEIFLESYLFADDRTGQRIAAALCRAAQRGVPVHVLLDGFGARDMSVPLRQKMLDAGVGVLLYRRNVSPLTLRRHRLRRMHRKIAVVDGRIAFVGGINVIDDMNTPGQVPPRHDYAVQIEGPLLAPIHFEVSRLWHWIALANLQYDWRPVAGAVVDSTPRGTQRAALLVRDNIRHRADIEDAYLETIELAREEIIIANAYFLPGIRFRHALGRATARGVRVVVLLQGRVEFMLLHYASRALYGTLLDAGVEIHEYHGSFLHAKVAVFDGRWATVGSSNIDPFSLTLAREANIMVDDTAFSGELRASLRSAMQSRGTEVAKTSWQRQAFWRKVPIWLAYVVVRMLLGMVGYAEKH
jgi:cardiolipin synthase